MLKVGDGDAAAAAAEGVAMLGIVPLAGGRVRASARIPAGTVELRHVAVR